MAYPSAVRVVEVGPRDGLQNERTIVPVAGKISFIENLSAAGLKTIEVGSFVSPKAVPAMADSADVIRGISRSPGVTYTALVPNEKGLQAALAAGMSEVSVFASASETFSQENLRSSISESLDRYRNVCQQAIGSSVRVRGYVSCVAGCPFEGPVAIGAVLHVAEKLLEMGCYEISLGDTIGIGTPRKIQNLLSQLLQHVRVDQLAVHFHDTWGQALANILVALEAGVSVIDSSAAGLGGCPYAPGATGNLATEDLVYMLEGMGVSTGIDLKKLCAASSGLLSKMGRAPASRYLTAFIASSEE